MLQIIDQRWREHLSEMDYLREGINLRAMGQQDPLVAWQREGYEMFGQMMDAHRRRLRHATSCTSRSVGRARRRARPDPGPATRRPRTRSQGPSLLEAMRAHGPGRRGGRRRAPGVPAGLDAGGRLAAGAQAAPRHQADGRDPGSRW